MLKELMYFHVLVVDKKRQQLSTGHVDKDELEIVTQRFDNDEFGASVDVYTDLRSNKKPKRLNSDGIDAYIDHATFTELIEGFDPTPQN